MKVYFFQNTTFYSSISRIIFIAQLTCVELGCLED